MFAGATLAAVYVLSEGGHELRLAGPVEDSGALPGWPGGYAVSGRSAVADAFRGGRPLWPTAAELAARREDVPAALAPDAALGVLPVGTDDRRLGCLIVVDDTGRGFDTDRRGFMELYAEQVAARLEAGGGPGTAYTVASGAGGTVPPGSVPRREGSQVAYQLMPGQALDAERVGAFTLELRTGRISADARMLELVDIAPGGFDGRVETLLAHAVPDDLPALMSLVEPGKNTSVGRELEFRVRRPAGDLRWLRLRSRVLDDPAGRPERVLGIVVDASSLRPGTDEVSLVQRLSASLAATMTARDVARVVVETLRDPLVGADRVAVAGLEADRLVVTALDPPEPGAWPGIWRSEWRSEWPDTPLRSLPTLAAALREVRVGLVPAGAELEPALAGVGPGGLALLPLPAEGRVIGACLAGWDEPHEFGAEERSLLTATAGLAGQALRRAHAFDARHELATTLQRSLLPRRLPELAGGVAVARYLPATAGLEVGGDWYDVIPLSESRVALVIGDVQGHSAGAATIMGQIRTAIRAYAVEGHPPDVVVSHANRLLVGMETDLFATCCYVELDMEEGDTWFVRAGHLAPLLRHPDGTAEEVATEGGLPLGVLADADYPITAVGLTPGTVLALLTDGLVESSSLHLEDGMLRMRALLSGADPADPGRVADRILGDGTRRDDDVALLLMRYDGMGTPPIRAGWTVWRLPDAVMHARRFTARTLRGWGVAEEADTALLVVSELVTNALVHTQGAVRLDLTLAGDRLRTAVTDASPRAPAKPVAADWESTGGRGLFLVEAVSESWGSVPVSGGKQVWSELAVARGPRPDTAAAAAGAAPATGPLPYGSGREGG
ncbi:SpoIIE family protein phosphatase [Streptomyces sp. TRM76323]|uniref:SpoIIE family protein phosphatase n=1 Tax=Streptomyces tamarix TaxID=3078565 RepID=A0ABU3QL18_9ACTN|nr:SpoIIE family protein phosphatase [Streptomyces tamarix]MDT9683077.1 SpoIIE family protein phosphatase [Streptomyces tamarix]